MLRSGRNHPIDIRVTKKMRGSASKRVLIAIAVVGVLIGCGCSGAPWQSPSRDSVTLTHGDRTEYLTEGQKPTLPLHWHLGSVDPRFNVTRGEVRQAIEQATQIWESAAGKELFREDDTSGFPVDLIFDERQAQMNEEDAAKKSIKAIETTLTASKDQELSAKSSYEEAKQRLDSEEGAFDGRLKIYDQRVDYWNTNGGAPPDAMQQLGSEKEDLTAEKARIQQADRDLDVMRTEVNHAVESYNQLVTGYHQSVVDFNRKFGTAATRIIGECHLINEEPKDVTIYAFEDQIHLTMVIAHELGHALGVQHVKGDGSLMSAVESGKKGPSDLRLSESDLVALRAALGK